MPEFFRKARRKDKSMNKYMYLVVRKLLTESLQSVSEERQLVQKITKRGNNMKKIVWNIQICFPCTINFYQIYIRNLCKT